MWYNMNGITARPPMDSDEAEENRFLQCPFHDRIVMRILLVQSNGVRSNFQYSFAHINIDNG